MEPGHKFCMYGCGIVALGLPVHNQTLCVDNENDVFLNVHDDRFYFSLERIQFSMPNVSRTSLISE
jgi:hypothetical protein